MRKKRTVTKAKSGKAKNTLKQRKTKAWAVWKTTIADLLAVDKGAEADGIVGLLPIG